MTRFAKSQYRPDFAEGDNDRRKELGELLRRARRQAHLTQTAVARTLGYNHQAHISRIETAKRMLDPIELENLARLYGKSLNDFSTWRKDQPSTAKLRARAIGHHKEALKVQGRYYKTQKMMMGLAKLLLFSLLPVSGSHSANLRQYLRRPGTEKKFTSQASPLGGID